MELWSLQLRPQTEMEASLKLVVPMMALMHLQSVNSNSINDTNVIHAHCVAGGDVGL